MTNEQAQGEMYHLLTRESAEYISFQEQRVMRHVKHVFMK